MSKRAKTESQLWHKVKQEREKLLREKYNYLPCEWCKGAINEGYHGHHNDHDRRNNVIGNARLLHFTCHMWIEDHNVNDVLTLL